MILGLQEVELLLDPVAGLVDSELQRLSRLVGDLNPSRAPNTGREEELSHQSSRNARTQNVTWHEQRARRFVSRHSGMQLQQRDNERDCPRQRALARELDAKPLRTGVRVPSDTLPPSALYLPDAARGGTSCSDRESFRQCCKVPPHKRDEK